MEQEDDGKRASGQSCSADLSPPERTLRHLIVHQAERLGSRPCLSVDGLTLSYEDLREAAARFAGSLQAGGVGPGDRVAVVSENRWEVVQCLIGCAWLGAIVVPINTASRGDQLEHFLGNAAPTVVAAEAAFLKHVTSCPRPVEVTRLWRIGPGDDVEWDGLRSTSFPGEADAVEPAEPRPGDMLALLYTSGTTGPSKGVCCPNAQFYWWGVNTGAVLGLTQDDVLYTCLPLFHTNAVNSFVQALVQGARFVLGPRFSASQFWTRVAEAGATVTYLQGAMVSILSAREPGPLDRAHRIRIALAPGTPVALHETFRERFGMEIVEAHGMTETNLVIGPRDDEQRLGTMGRVMPGFAARVVDDDDVEVPDGTPGELVMRSDEPFAFATGYWRLPEQTVAAWRNLWFHSGDRVVRDEDGYFQFLDRTKDAIRRRGENISAWEVEQVLQSHPDVAVAAVIPVPSELGEDDVMACVVAQPDRRVDPVDLISHCEPRLAYFAIPRYIQFLPELPLTGNGKIQKFVLRDRGITPDTWDREAAGITLRR